MLRARITGTGGFLPETVWTNAKLESLMDTTDEWIRKRTGIGQRHLAAAGEGSSDLGAPAARDALLNAGVAPEDVELIICCTTTPDYLFPATACMIQERIGAENAGAFDLNAACTGFVTGLATATAYIRAGIYRTVLVVGAEAQTNRLNWAKRETAVLFGDGAGATLLQADEGDRGVLSTFLGADGSGGDMLIIPGGGSKAPLTQENLDGSGLDIEMKGAELFKRATLLFEEASMKALELAGLHLDDVDLFVPHQANARIIGAAARRLGLPEEKVVLNLERVANTTSASIPLALHEAVAEGRVKDGDLLLLAGFGAGLTWGAAAVRW